MKQYNFTNQVDGDGNTYVQMEIVGETIRTWACGAVGLALQTPPTAPGKFEIMGKDIGCQVNFIRAEVLTPVAASDADLKTALDSIFNCCTCP